MRAGRRLYETALSPERMPNIAPGGPFLTSPGLLGPCARATTEQPRGQNGHIKNDLE